MRTTWPMRHPTYHKSYSSFQLCTLITMARTLQPDDLDRIRSYLELPPDVLLPIDPLRILTEYVDTLPRTLLEPFAEITTPRERARVRTIKSRRIMHASSRPPPAFLSADAGRLRWPLLWERMGGSTALPPPSSSVREEETWVKDQFLGEGDGDSRQHVKKLGGLLRGFEEEREAETVRERKRVERRMDEVGEEFDSESDEEDGVGGRTGNARVGAAVQEDEDQEAVARAFERKLVELFVDGLDVSVVAQGDPFADTE